jgi:hypothetical protein
LLQTTAAKATFDQLGYLTHSGAACPKVNVTSRSAATRRNWCFRAIAETHGPQKSALQQRLAARRATIICLMIFAANTTSGDGRVPGERKAQHREANTKIDMKKLVLMFLLAWMAFCSVSLDAQILKAQPTPENPARLIQAKHRHHRHRWFVHRRRHRRVHRHRHRKNKPVQTIPSTP